MIRRGVQLAYVRGPCCRDRYGMLRNLAAASCTPAIGRSPRHLALSSSHFSMTMRFPPNFGWTNCSPPRQDLAPTLLLALRGRSTSQACRNGSDEGAFSSGPATKRGRRLSFALPATYWFAPKYSLAWASLTTTFSSQAERIRNSFYGFGAPDIKSFGRTRPWSGKQFPETARR